MQEKAAKWIMLCASLLRSSTSTANALQRFIARLQRQSSLSGK